MSEVYELCLKVMVSHDRNLFSTVKEENCKRRGIRSLKFFAILYHRQDVSSSPRSRESAIPSGRVETKGRGCSVHGSKSMRNGNNQGKIRNFLHAPFLILQ